MASAERWLIRNASIDGHQVDCRLRDGRVAEVAARLDATAGEQVLDAGGGELLPGLADHHVHVLAAAAARASVDLRGGDDLRAPLVAAGSGWLRVVGAGRELTSDDIDAVWADRPVRVQHRSGALWTLNSTAVDLLGHGLTGSERRTGQIWRADVRLRRLLADVNDGLDEHLAALGQEFATSGVTHLSDATPDLDSAGLARIRAAIPQHVIAMSEVGSGPRKLVVADHEPPDLTALSAAVTSNHAVGRPVALHAVSAEALAVVIAVLHQEGVLPGDRVEHAALCDDEAALRLAELDVTIVTQPTIFGRYGGSFRDKTPERDWPWLWRHAGLLERGVRVVVSSDAPVGYPDPAETVRAGLTRDVEGVEARTSFQSYLLDPLDLTRGPRTVAPGSTADLCLLKESIHDSLTGVAQGGALGVQATWVGGQRTVGETKVL